MYDGPIREGSRGGRDQFSWESVKGDKDREFYLGHSVKALVGHWQKNKDPYWYARNKEGKAAELADEVKAVKRKEEELMLEALGMKKATKKQTTDFGKKLQKYEVDELLRRREKEDGDEQEVEELGARGLGFRRTATALASTTTHEVLEGVGVSGNPPQQIRSAVRTTSVPSDRSIGKKKKREKNKNERKESKKKPREEKQDKHRRRHRSRSRSPRGSTRKSKQRS